MTKAEFWKTSAGKTVLHYMRLDKVPRDSGMSDELNDGVVMQIIQWDLPVEETCE